MEIRQTIDPKLADYYSQLIKVPNHIVYVDTGYFNARATIKRVNKITCRADFIIHPEDAQLLRDKIEEGMK